MEREKKEGVEGWARHVRGQTKKKNKEKHEDRGEKEEESEEEV